MRPTISLTVLLILLFAGCKKDNAPINFSSNISGDEVITAAFGGNASTSFNSMQSQPEPAFELTMNGPSGSSLTLLWYNLDSVNAENLITTRTYNIPVSAVGGLAAPFTMAAVYGPPNNSVTGDLYYSGNGSGGTVTITKNTGPGGVISGTFTCSVINEYSPYDTIHFTNGVFTNVPVAAQ